MKIKKVAIVGFGQFGRLMAKHLEPHCEVIPCTRHDDVSIITDCDAVIFSVPYGSLEEVVVKLKKHIKKDALVLDVTSVKQKPLAILKKYFKDHQILGTHPVFGPQSGKNGIKGLPIVLCNVSFSKANYSSIKKFLKNKLELHVIEQTPKQHDHEMANVQALTHFIGRALANLKIQSYVTNTQSYKQLLELVDLIGQDSWELFKTIQNTNGEAKVVRKKLLREFASIEKKLEEN